MATTQSRSKRNSKKRPRDFVFHTVTVEELTKPKRPKISAEVKETTRALPVAELEALTDQFMPWNMPAPKYKYPNITPENELVYVICSCKPHELLKAHTMRTHYSAEIHKTHLAMVKQGIAEGYRKWIVRPPVLEEPKSHKRNKSLAPKRVRPATIEAK